jgi:stage V sporulation protein B
MGGDAERLVIGFSYSMVAGLLSGFFLYLAGLMVMGLLGPKDYGFYQLVLVIPGLLVPILNLGVELTLVRFVSRFRVDERETAVRMTRFLFLLRISVSAVACLAIVLLAPWIADVLGENVEEGVRLVAFFLLGYMLYLFGGSVFQAFFLMRERTVIMVVHGIIYLGTVPLAIYLGLGYLAPIAAAILTNFAAFLLATFLALRRGVLMLPSRSKEGLRLREQLRFAAPTYITLLTVALFTQAGVILIRFAGLEVVQVGYFRAVYNVVGVGSFIAITLNVVVLPYISELESKGDTTSLRYFCSLITKLLTIVSVPSAVGIYLISQPFLELILPEYLAAVPLMQMLSLMLLLHPIWIVANAMLMGVGRPRLVMQSNLLATVTVIGAGAVLAFIYSTRGIALAYILAGCLGTIYSLLKLREATGLDLELPGVLKVGVATAVMWFAVSSIMGALGSASMKILVGVPIGIALYLGLVLILRITGPEEIRVLRKTLTIARRRAAGPLYPD